MDPVYRPVLQYETQSKGKTRSFLDPVPGDSDCERRVDSSGKSTSGVTLTTGSRTPSVRKPDSVGQGTGADGRWDEVRTILSWRCAGAKSLREELFGPTLDKDQLTAVGHRRTPLLYVPTPLLLLPHSPTPLDVSPGITPGQPSPLSFLGGP